MLDAIHASGDCELVAPICSVKSTGILRESFCIEVRGSCKCSVTRNDWNTTIMHVIGVYERFFHTLVDLILSNSNVFDVLEIMHTFAKYLNSSVVVGSLEHEQSVLKQSSRPQISSQAEAQLPADDLFA